MSMIVGFSGHGKACFFHKPLDGGYDGGYFFAEDEELPTSAVLPPVSDEPADAGPVLNVTCPFCGEDTAPDYRFCLCCGKDLDGRELKRADSVFDPDITLKLCRRCRAGIPAYARYCGFCGWDQNEKIVGERLDQTETGDSSGGPQDIDPFRQEFQMTFLEVVYLHTRGLDVGSEEASQAFPFGWYRGSAEARIRALDEAIRERIPIEETSVWLNEMSEGVR